jgi:hypothetical protein
MKMIAGFRNILVHDYLKIDDQAVFASLNNLDDLKSLQHAPVGTTSWQQALRKRNSMPGRYQKELPRSYAIL